VPPPSRIERTRRGLTGAWSQLNALLPVWSASIVQMDSARQPPRQECQAIVAGGGAIRDCDDAIESDDRFVEIARSARVRAGD